MAQGDPIARGNIELGANTAPMEAALAGAKDKAVAQAQEIQQAVNTTVAAAPQAAASTATTMAAEVAKATDEERYQIALQEMATRQEIHRRERVALEDMRRGTQRLAASARPFADQMRDATQAMGRLAGMAAIFTAATVGAFKLGQTIRDYILEALKSSNDKVKEFKENMDLSDVEGSIAATSKQINKLTGEIEERERSYRLAFLTPIQNSSRLRGLKDEVALLQQTIRLLRETKEAKRLANERDDAVKEQREQIKALRLEIDKLNQTTFSRLEVSVEKIGAYVELLARRMGRDA